MDITELTGVSSNIKSSQISQDKVAMPREFHNLDIFSSRCFSSASHRLLHFVGKSVKKNWVQKLNSFWLLINLQTAPLIFG